MDNLKNLYEVQEIVACSLEDAIKKAKQNGGKVSTTGDSEHLRNLVSAYKNSQIAIAMDEEQGGDSYSMMGGIEPGRGSRQAYRAYAYDGSYNMSGRRGRSPSTGRFVSRAGGYSGHDAEYMDLLQDAMEKAPDEASRRKLEQMMQQM